MMKRLLLVGLVGAALAGCSGGSDDEGGKSTATPADQLNRPAPVSVSGGPATPTVSKGAGTLPPKK